jgi:hypothetical protein
MFASACGTTTQNAAASWTNSDQVSFYNGCVGAVGSAIPTATAIQKDSYCYCMLTAIMLEYTSEEYFAGTPDTTAIHTTCRASAGI